MHIRDIDPRKQNSRNVSRFTPIGLLVLTLATAGNTPAASEQNIALDLPAQPLQITLNQIANASHTQLIYADSVVKGLQAGAIRGPFTVRQALEKALNKTGLKVDSVGNALLIAQDSRQDAAVNTLPPVEVSAKAVADVNDPNNHDYALPNSTAGTKTDTPILETPFSVQIISKQVLADRQVTQLSQAVNNISGIIAADERTGGLPAFFIRGFLSNNYYINGVRYPSVLTGTNQNLVNVERVEVLKGPASILYGRNDPGGFVNLISKQPLETPYTSIQQQIGSFSDFRTTLDTTGPLTQDKTLLYRFNGAFESNGSYINFGQGEDTYIAPTLRWNINDQTFVNFYLTFQHRNINDTAPAPAFTGPGPNSNAFYSALGNNGEPVMTSPRQTNFDQPFSQSGSDETVAGFNWSHDFNENWNIKHRFQAQVTSFQHLFAGPSGYDASVPFQVNNFAVNTPNIDTEAFFTGVDLTGKFTTYGLQHTLLLGSDFTTFSQRGYELFDFNVPPSNLLSPVYYDRSILTFDPASRFDFGFQETFYGLYLQDQVKLPYHFTFLAGERFNKVDLYDTVLQSKVTDASRVTPRFGLVWQPFEEVSFYGSYTTNFGNSALTSTRALPPESANQWEVGIKSEWLDKRLISTVAFYELTRNNSPALDLTDPTFLRQIAIGQARSKGVEFDISGEILPGWRVIGSYTYTDTLITRDVGDVFDAATGALLSTVGNQGKRLGLVPRNYASLFSTYQFLDGDLRGFKFGGGILLRDRAPGDNFNDYSIPGYATVSLIAGYETKVLNKKITLQLNANNLLNKHYIDSSFTTPFAAHNGAPRSFLGSIRVEF